MKPTEFVKVNAQFWGSTSGSQRAPAGEPPAGAGRSAAVSADAGPDRDAGLEHRGAGRHQPGVPQPRGTAAEGRERRGVLRRERGLGGRDAAGENLFKDATVATARRPPRDRGAVPGCPGDDRPGVLRAGRRPAEVRAGQLLDLRPDAARALGRIGAAGALGVLRAGDPPFGARGEVPGLPAQPHRRRAAHRPGRDAERAAATTAPTCRARSSQSTYLAHDVPNSTVDQFLSANEDFLLTAFDATKLIRQPHLEWQSGDEPR